MSDKNIELPRLRPYARQGKAYHDELKAILKEIQFRVKEDVKVFHQRNGKITPRFVCQLALKYKLNLKAMFDFLEDEHLIAFGTYENLKDRGLCPMAALKEVWAAMQQEQEVTR